MVEVSLRWLSDANPSFSESLFGASAPALLFLAALRTRSEKRPFGFATLHQFATRCAGLDRDVNHGSCSIKQAYTRCVACRCCRSLTASHRQQVLLFPACNNTHILPDARRSHLAHPINSASSAPLPREWLVENRFQLPPTISKGRSDATASPPLRHILPIIIRDRRRSTSVSYLGLACNHRIQRYWTNSLPAVRRGNQKMKTQIGFHARDRVTCGRLVESQSVGFASKAETQTQSRP